MIQTILIITIIMLLTGFKIIETDTPKLPFNKRFELQKITWILFISSNFALIICIGLLPFIF